MEINWDEIDDSIDELTFKNDIKYGKVVSVYDGDTIKVVFLLGNKLYKWNCRLDRVDTPELRTRNDLEKELDFRIISLFQFINSLGHYTNHRWFNNLNNIQIINWCNGLSDIWFYRAQISNQVKARIYPHGNPFISLTRPLSTNMSLYTLRKTCVGICENLIYSGINNDDKNMGAYYVLTSLTLQSSDAAVALPWLFQSVI